MPRWVDQDDDHDDWDDEAGVADEYDDETVPCPHCGRDVYEDAEQCPRCGKYLSREDAPPQRKPWWVVLGVIVCLYIVYRWIVWF